MKRNIVILFTFIGCLFLSSSKADSLSVDKKFNAANQFYIDGQFEEAIREFEDILEQGFESAALYYNLGNAYFKQRKISPAILNYERAQRLRPNDEDIQFNLEMAYKQIPDEIDALPEFFLAGWWRSVYTLLPLQGWAILVISFFTLMLVSLALFYTAKSLDNRKNGLIFTAVTSTLMVLAVIFAQQQYHRLKSDDHAIVFTPSVTVKGSPGESGTDLFIIHEGLKVEIEDRVAGWLEVRLPNGKVGWIPEEDVQVI